MASEWTEEDAVPEVSEECNSVENLYTGCVLAVGSDDEEEEEEDAVPEEVVTILDDVFNKLLNEGRGYDETVYDLLLVWKEYPGIDLDRWFDGTSLAFKRYCMSILNGYHSEKYNITAAAVHRLAARRGVDVPRIDTTYYPSDDEEEEEEDEEPVIIAEKGDWLKVDCTKGVYYYNEVTQESQWDVVGTPFESEEGTEPESSEEKTDEKSASVNFGETLVYSAMDGTLTESEIDRMFEGSPKRKHVTINDPEVYTTDAEHDDLDQDGKRKKRRKRDPAKERERKKAQKKRRRSSRIATQEDIAEEEAASHYIEPVDEEAEDAPEDMQALLMSRRVSTPCTPQGEGDPLRLM